MKESKFLEVYIGDAHVGTLAETKERLVAFEYTDEWLRHGFSISPLSLPLEKKVFIPRKYDPFDGLFGVFSDSLPDGWGRLLVDRLLTKNGILPDSVSSLTRLAIVGDSGMGALSYKPSSELKVSLSNMSLDELAIECSRMFETEDTEYIDDLYKMAGSSGGARPKVNYEMDGSHWIVKFPSSIDRKDIGLEEYDYSLCAKKCGVSMSETKLLPSKICSGFFATKRFDRKQNKKIHMISAGALLETSHRIPNLDYEILMNLTLHITRNYEELEKLYKLMCFNVFSHNRDDHSKNFSYIYENGTYMLSPAYDLTYSNSIGGEHATTINGNGRNPGLKDILAIANKIGLDKNTAEKIAINIKEIVDEDLKKYIARP